jgi:hypothetical protein
MIFEKLDTWGIALIAILTTAAMPAAVIIHIIQELF